MKIIETADTTDEDLPEKLAGGAGIHFTVPEADRSNPADDIAQEYYVELSPNIPGGCIIWGKHRGGAWYANASGRWLVSKLLEKRLSRERLPQRFRYRKPGCNGWDYGVCNPCGSRWKARTNTFGFAWFEADPWEALGQVIGDVEAFEWIDNDYGWEGMKHGNE